MKREEWCEIMMKWTKTNELLQKICDSLSCSITVQMTDEEEKDDDRDGND